jgi:hypothetical protein
MIIVEAHADAHAVAVVQLQRVACSGWRRRAKNRAHANAHEGAYGMCVYLYMLHFSPSQGRHAQLIE